MAPIGILLRTVFEAILEVFLLCLSGYVLARKEVLDKRTQKQINRLNVSLFTPALLFSKVAFSLSPEKLRELWVIPIFFIIVTVVSMAVAYVLGVIFRLKRSQRNFAIAAAMFMNSNSLPIALMQSLVVTVPNLRWDEDDNKTAMLGRALSYLVLYSTLGMVLRWSYGVHLLSQADPEGTELETNQEFEPYHDRPEEQLLISIEDHSQPPQLPPNDSTPSITFEEYTRGNTYANGRQEGTEDHTLRVPPHEDRQDRPKPQVFFSFPNTPIQSNVQLPIDSNNSSLTLDVSYQGSAQEDSESDGDEPLRFTPHYHHRHSIFRRIQGKSTKMLRRIWKAVKKFSRAINQFMTAPLWAAALSLIVALVPALQHTLDSHVQPFKGALTAAGNCSIPLTLIVLGAYFFTPATPSEIEGDQSSDRQIGSVRREESEDEVSRGRRSVSFAGSVRSMLRLSRLDRWESNLKTKGSKKTPRPGETRTVAIAVVSRMILTPLLLFPLMAVGARYDFPKVFDDPVFVVSNILLISSPPALTLAQITQAASGDAFERLISRTIFWAYCILTPPATIIYVVVGLMFAKL